MRAEVLQALSAYLKAQGVTAPIYLQALPPSGPDVAVLLNDYGDADSPPWVTEGRLQVIVRGARGDVKSAKDLAEQIHGILRPPGADPHVVAFAINGQPREVRIDHLSGPLHLGPDELQRYLFSANYRVILDALWLVSSTYTPCPLAALRHWTAQRWNEVQLDPTSWQPRDDAPAVYWRLVGTEGVEPQSWGAWVNVRIHGHVLAPSEAGRLQWVARIVRSLALDRRCKMDDGSDLSFVSVQANSEADYIRTGQIVLRARFGVLHETGDVPILARAAVSGAVTGEVT